MEDETLKKQFQQLQEQQAKKLQRRKEKKAEKSKAKENTSLSLQSVRSFGIDDDLGLKLADPPSNVTIDHGQKSEQLQEQIRELKDETGRLYKLLSERDLELRQLRKKQNEQKDAMTAGTGAVTNETAAQKIVELSKKVRELTAEVQSEKTKARQMTKKCMDLENELENQRSGKDKVQGSSSISSAGSNTFRSYENGESQRPTQEDLTKLQKKINHLELKMSEQRNQSQSLRNELKMAQKVLEQEIGESVSFQSLLNNSGGWRGRAQQIVALQKKVNELKSQVDHQNVSRAETIDLEDEFMGTATSRRNLDARHRDEIRKMEKDRKEQQERMGKELKALEKDYEALKQKLDASKARNKVLSNENKAHKQQMQTLIDKGKHDDELISALFKQQSQLKDALEESSTKQKSIEEKNEQASKSLAIKSQQENNLVEQLKAIVAEKEAKVHALEEEIRQGRLANLQKAQLEGANSLFDNSRAGSAQFSRPGTSASRPSTAASSRPPTVQALVIEEVPSPTPGPGSSRPGSSRPPTADMNGRPASGRKMSARPSSADRKRLEELQLQCQEFQSLYQAATVERDRLTELVQVLQQRIEEVTLNVTETQNELQTQKRKNVQLEKQIGKVKMEQSQSAVRKTSKSKTAMSAASLREAVAMDNFDDGGNNIEELQTNLEIQRDENEALKAALQRTLQAKQEDLRVYNQMLEDTKQVFLQGLRQYRGTQS